MRVFHIIPSAFEYFKDIKENAFALVEEVEKIEKAGLRVESSISTLQYSGPTKNEMQTLRTIVPEKEYYGEYAPSDLVEQFADYDIIHLHAPFLGGGGLIKKWREACPDQPFVITYHRDVIITDLFAYAVRWYNDYYLPKLFSMADVVTCLSVDNFRQSRGAKLLRNPDRAISLLGADTKDRMLLTDVSDKVKLEQRKIAANILFKIYNLLLK